MSRPRRTSIRTRLALIYTGVLAGALVVFGTGAYLVLRGELARSFDAALVANAEHAAGAFAQDVDGNQLSPSQPLLEQFAATGGRVVVLDATGRVVADSAPSSAPAIRLTAEDLAAADRHALAVREFVVDGDARRLAVEPILDDGSLAGYVAWTDSTRPVREVLATVATAMLVGGLVLVGIALIGGLVLARRALAPVADVTETARAISLSGDFGARVEAGEASDEVGELAIAFNEMLAALEQSHQALQRFLADASHQLRSPLTTIRANLDLAQRAELPGEERAAILSDAREEAERMARLVGDLLGLARAESGVRLEFAPVELDALLVELVRLHREAAPHVQMSIDTVEPAVVEGDRDRLRELIGILLDNAGRYTPEGGSVVVTQQVADGWTTVRVEDTGIGLAGEDRERLFERLYRGDRARELRPSGTGLGLAIGRWIAEAHGGSIDLDERRGGGTVATVRLPLRPS